MKNILTLLFCSLCCLLNAQTWEPLEYDPNQIGLEKNPLKGISALFGSNNDFPHAVSGLTLTMGQVMTGMNEFRFEEVIEPFLAAEAAAGRTVILQINVDSGKNINPNEDPELPKVGEFDYNELYLGDRYDLPDFLDGQVNKLFYLGKPAVQVDASGNELTDASGNPIYEEQDTTGDNVFPWAGQAADNQGRPSVVIDYNDPDFVSAWLNLVQALGTKYNNDDRIFIIHYGTYGIFGEWDLGFGKNYISSVDPSLTEDSWKMNQGVQEQIINAFQSAFPSKNLIARVPEVPRPLEVGYSDGLFFGASISDKAEEFFFFLPKLKQYNADLNWRNYPIGGEVDPAIQPLLWDQPDFAVEDFNYFVTGDPDLAGDGASGQNVGQVFEQTHPTFLFQNEVLFDAGLPNPKQCDGDDSNGESSAEICENNDPDEWAKAILASKKCGYTFHINQFKLSAANSKTTVEVNIQNKGLAPMYADWEVELAYIDGEGGVESLGRTNQSNNWNISTIQPDVEENYRSFTASTDIPDGTFQLLLKIVNPYEDIAGAQVIPVSFANTSQDADKDGWLSLGGPVMIVDGSLGTPPVAATSLSVSPATATINRGTILELEATVLPLEATNQEVTWSSSDPFIADVDENGLVTAGALSGTATIIAFADNGNIEAQALITVEGYWNIPSLIEAEDFSMINKGEVSVNLTADPEGGTHLANLDFSDELVYGVEVAETETFVINVRMANPSGGGSFDILVDGIKLQTLELDTTPPKDEMSINNGFYESQYSKAFELEPGRHDITIITLGGAYNLNWLDFQIFDPCLVNADLDEGDACDDANPNTVNDVIQSDCTCAGTPGSEIFWPIPGRVEAEHWASTTSDFPGNNIAMPSFGDDVEGGEGNFVGGLIFSRKLDYQIDATSTGQYTLDFRAASPQDGGEFNIYLDGQLVIPNYKLEDTDGPNGPDDFGDYSIYATQSTEPFIISSGQHTVRLEILQGSFDLNWIEFREFIEPIDYVTIPAQIEAEDYLILENAQLVDDPESEDPADQAIGFIGDETTVDYAINVVESSNFTLDFRAISYSGPADAQVNVLLNGDLLLENVAFGEGGVNGTYGTYTSSEFTLPAGDHIITVDVTRSNFDLNWIEFKSVAPCPDADGDGVCDADDICADLDDNLIGTPCDDGDASTIGDVYTVNCECAGTVETTFIPIPALIEAEDFVDVFNAEVNPAPEGETGGDILGFIGDDTWMEYAVSVSESAEFVLDFRAASPFGVSVIDVLNAAGETLTTINLTPATAGYDTYATYTSAPFTLPEGDYRIRLDVVASAFNLNWIAFRIDETCPDADGDGVCDAEDVCADLDDNLIGTPCDDGDACTTGDIYTTDCGCAGTYADADGDGVCDAEDVCTDLDDNLIGTPCDDGDACTTGDVYTTDCGCTGTPTNSALINEGFNNTTGAFSFISGVFSSSQPTYENFIQETHAAVLEVGGVDNKNKRDMSLGLGATFNVTGSASILIDIDYELKAHWGYEDDEWTEAIVELDGRRINYNGNNYLSKLVGGSPSTTGDQSVRLQLFGLSEGNHTLVIGLLNNKKTYRKEKSTLIIDQIMVTQDCEQLACELGAPCDDGNICTNGDVIDSDCNCVGTYVDSDILEEGFDNTIGAFTAISGAFSYSNSHYENVIEEANRVVLEVGGVDNSTRRNMSLGLGTSFNTYGEEDVFIELDYELTAHHGYENDEWTKAIIEIDGLSVQYNGENYLSRLVGGSPSTTGIQHVSLQISGLPPGSHTVVVGLLNNKKTYRLEKSTMIIDHISIIQDCFPASNTFTANQDKQDGNKLVDVPRTKPTDDRETELLAFEEEDLEYDFEVFPNPTVDFININYSLSEGKIGLVKIMDITGRLILTRSQTGDGELILEKVNTAGWNEGIYIVVVEADNLIKTEKVVVMK